MKFLRKFGMALICGALLLGQASCGMSNTGKGAIFGGAGGAALGAGIGALIGGGKGAAIGAGVGAGVGAGTGALIGNRMDKQQRELQEQLKNQAQVDTITDRNGFTAIKVTFDGGILFGFNQANLSAQAQSDLAKFAANIKQYPGTLIQIYGFTDNIGTAAANKSVSTKRADAVFNYLKAQGIPADRMQAEGLGPQYPVASNDTPEGQAKNRRVEVYISASPEMIQQAQNGTLQ